MCQVQEAMHVYTITYAAPVTVEQCMLLTDESFAIGRSMKTELL